MAYIKELQVGQTTYNIKDAQARASLLTKQDALTFDNAPTSNSDNPVKSGGVYSALATKADQADTYTKEQVNNLIVPANTEIFVIDDVSELPSEGVSNTIYRVSGDDSYTDYGWDGTEWIPLATYNGTNLYSFIGQNTDGAMSQKAVMDALDGETIYIETAWSKSQIEGMAARYRVNPNGDVFDNAQRGRTIPNFNLYRGKRVRIIPDGDSAAIVAFMKGWPGSYPSNPVTDNYHCNADPWLFEVESAIELIVPDDCNYLYVTYQTGSTEDTTITPLSIQIVSDVKDKISDLEDALQSENDELTKRVIYNDITWTKTNLDGMDNTRAINPDGDLFVSVTSPRYGRKIGVEQYRGKNIRITRNGDNEAVFAFLKSQESAAGDPADYCYGHQGLITIDDEPYEGTIPNDCSYLHIQYQFDEGVIAPSTIEIYTTVKDKIKKLEDNGAEIVELEMTGGQISALPIAGFNLSESHVTVKVGNNYNARVLEVENYRGSELELISNSTHYTFYAFLQSLPAKVGQATPYCNGETIHRVEVDTTVKATIPNDCAYLYITNLYAGIGSAPSSIKITTTVVQKLKNLHTGEVDKPDVIYLSQNGNDDYDGMTPATAKATFNTAMETGSKNMEIVLLSDIYESIDLNAWNGKKKSLTIRGAGNTRARIIVGRKLENLVPYDENVYTYTPNEEEALPSYTDDNKHWLWQHDLEDKSTLIPINERHPLQRGREYRRLSTPLEPASSLEALLSTSEPCWYNDGTDFYIRVVAGSDVETNPIYIPEYTGSALRAGDFDVTLSNIECWYGNIYIGHSDRYSDCLFKAFDCAARYCCGGGAWVSRNAISVHLERCEADSVTMKKTINNSVTGDGINLHFELANTPPYAKGCTHTLIDCWSHDNRDDGYSDHDKSEGTIIGGLFEHNGKAGIAPAQGAHDTVYNATVSNNNRHGILTGMTATDGGVGTQTVCFGCVAISNEHNYTCQGGSNVNDNSHKLILNGCISRDSTEEAIYATGHCEVIVRDCTDYNSSPSYISTNAVNGGIITINNGTIITD